MRDNEREKQYFQQALIRARQAVAKAIKEAGWNSNGYQSLRLIVDRHIADGFTLADLETSEEELERLRIVNCRLRAVAHLENLRRLYVYDANLRELDGCMKDGGFSLVDLGSSEEEIIVLKEQYDALIRSFHER